MLFFLPIDQNIIDQTLLHMFFEIYVSVLMINNNDNTNLDLNYFGAQIMRLVFPSEISGKILYIYIWIAQVIVKIPTKLIPR